MNPALLFRVLRRQHGHPADVPSDADLLRQYAATKDPHIFEELVHRHGRLVWGVCRRTLGHKPDAEDAYQGTFLVLANRARSIRNPAALSSWLHGVALRVATRIRQRRPVQAEANADTAAPAADAHSLREYCLALDEELARLPEKLRQPLVLCFLEEATQDEAARRLGISLSTLKRRLDAGKERLRERLQRRGIDFAAALAAVGLSATAPPTLALGVSTGLAVTIAQEVGLAMSQMKIISWSLGLLAAGSLATGGGIYFATSHAQGPVGGGGPSPGKSGGEAKPATGGGGLPGMGMPGAPGMPGMPGQPSAPPSGGLKMPGMPGGGIPGMPGGMMPGIPGEALHEMSGMPGGMRYPAAANNDIATLEYEVKVAEIEVKRAEVEAIAARRKYDRLNGLKATGAVELQIVAQAQLDAEISLLNVDKAQAQLRFAVSKLQQAKQSANLPKAVPQVDEVRKLRADQLATAKSANQLLNEIMNKGAITREEAAVFVHSLVHWSSRIFELEKHLATNPGQTLQAARDHVERCKSAENYFKIRAERGLAREFVALEATFARQEAEALLKELETQPKRGTR